MRSITIRKWLTRSLIALLVAGGVAVGAEHLFAQPGQTPNTARLRGAALGSAPALTCQGLDTNINCDVVPKGSGTLTVNGSAVLTTAGGTFTTLTINPGPFSVSGTTNLTGAVNVTGDTSLTGNLLIRPGTAAVLKRVGARIFHSVTDAPTTGTVIETLYTHNLAANTLAVDGQSLDINVWATTAGNGNNKTLTVVFGATTIGTSTAQAFNGETMNLKCNVYRTGAATQKARCVYQSFTTGTFTANNNFVVSSSTPGETLSGAVAILVRGTTPTAAADLTANAATIDWQPVGQ